jgi:hypothetical protein
MILRAFATFPLNRSRISEANCRAVRTTREAGRACNPFFHVMTTSELFMLFRRTQCAARSEILDYKNVKYTAPEDPASTNRNASERGGIEKQD